MPLESRISACESSIWSFFRLSVHLYHNMHKYYFHDNTNKTTYL